MGRDDLKLTGESKSIRNDKERRGCARARRAERAKKKKKSSHIVYCNLLFTFLLFKGLGYMCFVDCDLERRIKRGLSNARLVESFMRNKSSEV